MELILTYWVGSVSPGLSPGAALAVAIAFVLRGMGGGRSGAAGAQGDLFTETYETGNLLRLRSASPGSGCITVRSAAEGQRWQPAE